MISVIQSYIGKVVTTTDIFSLVGCCWDEEFSGLLLTAVCAQDEKIMLTDIITTINIFVVFIYTSPFKYLFFFLNLRTVFAQSVYNRLVSIYRKAKIF